MMTNVKNHADLGKSSSLPSQVSTGGCEERGTPSVGGASQIKGPATRQSHDHRPE